MPSATSIAIFLVAHSAVALLVGLACSYALMFMPDGTGPVLAVSPERARRLVASEGALARVLQRDPRERLRETCTHHARGAVIGAESVIATSNGSLLALDRTGALFRLDPSPRSGGGYDTRRVAYVGPGRPLGYHLAPGGEHLLVCDSLKGLLELHLPSRELRILHSLDPYANDLDVAPDPSRPYGRVYFSSSTREPVELTRSAHGPFYDTMHGYLRCQMRGDATGKLLEYDPATREVRTLLQGLWFANGVALSASADFVLVVETLGFRVLRLWLAGARAGTSEDFASALPGFPDGIVRAADGEHFLLAIIAPWSPLLKFARFRLVRGLLARMVRLTLRAVTRKKVGLVLKLRASDGAIVDVYADSTGEHVATVSAVSEAPDGRLLLGQLQGDSVPECTL